MKQYNLPLGGYTWSLEEYLGQWDALANKVAAFFPGYVLSSRDPNLSFVKYGVNGLGQTVVVDRLTLSPDSIAALTAPVKGQESP